MDVDSPLRIYLSDVGNGNVASLYSDSLKWAVYPGQLHHISW